MIVSVLVMGLAGCSGKDGPLAASSPSLGPLTGNWQGQMTRTSFTGSGCGAASIPSIDRGGWLITQLNGTTDVLSPLGHYNGTANGSSFVLQGGASSITGFRVICDAPAGTQGASREVRFAGGTLTATVDGNSMTGTTVDTWNEYAAGTQTLMTTMVAKYSFSITKFM